MKFQNGSLSDEFSSGLDIRIAKGIQNDNTDASSLLLALSNDNVYGGLIDANSSCNLKKMFIGIRKRTSEEVSDLMSTTNLRNVSLKIICHLIGKTS